MPPSPSINLVSMLAYVDQQLAREIAALWDVVTDFELRQHLEDLMNLQALRRYLERRCQVGDRFPQE